jgi:hypothetical protein
MKRAKDKDTKSLNPLKVHGIELLMVIIHL